MVKRRAYLLGRGVPGETPDMGGAALAGRRARRLHRRDIRLVRLARSSFGIALSLLLSSASPALSAPKPAPAPPPSATPAETRSIGGSLVRSLMAQAAISVAQSSSPSCTLSASATSVTAGTRFTLSWSATHNPTAGYITQGQSVRLLRPLPFGTSLLSSGSTTLTALATGAYTYTLTTSNPSGPGTCSTTVRVTGTATPPDIPTVVDRIGLATAVGISGHDPNIRKYDILWTVNPLTATSPVMSGFYIPYNREPLGVPGQTTPFGAEEHHPISWYLANRPDWLVYKNDRTQLAVSFEYRNAAGQPYHLPPIDITNPAVRQYIWDRRIAPALLEGHRLISFDNGTPFNVDQRAGVKNASGEWRQLFGAHPSDPVYVQAMREWLEWMRRRINAAGARVIMNVDYGRGGEADFISIASAADMVLNEASFVNQYCSKQDYHYQDDVPGRPDPDVWTERFTTFRTVARQRGLVLTHSCTASQIQPGVVSWAIANYLLVRGPHTFIAFYYGQTSPTTRSLVIERPEFNVQIGSPAGEPTRISGTKMWSRPYTNGIVLVNPSATTPHSTTLPPGTYRDLEGNIMQGRITLSPTTGLVLLYGR